MVKFAYHMDGRMQNCGISSAEALEIPQPCIQPSVFSIKVILFALLEISLASKQIIPLASNIETIPTINFSGSTEHLPANLDSRLEPWGELRLAMLNPAFQIWKSRHRMKMIPL